jgi:uncharacterized protein (TIGR03435 family)
MRGFLVSALCLIVGCGAAFGQETNTKFEVASVRPSTEQTATPANSGMRGGPGTADPERFFYPSVPLKTLLLRVYGLNDYQFSGPSSLASTRVDILAKVPPASLGRHPFIS